MFACLSKRVYASLHSATIGPEVWPDCSEAIRFSQCFINAWLTDLETLGGACCRPAIAAFPQYRCVRPYNHCFYEFRIDLLLSLCQCPVTTGQCHCVHFVQTSRSLLYLSSIFLSRQKAKKEKDNAWPFQSLSWILQHTHGVDRAIDMKCIPSSEVPSVSRKDMR